VVERERRLLHVKAGFDGERIRVVGIISL